MNNDSLWKLLNDLWEKGTNKSKFVKECVDYWEGKVSESHKKSNFQKTGTNVINPIIETKLRAVLDADFTFSVVPQIKSFQNLQTIKEVQAIADILNDELHNIFLNNNFNSLKEKVCRYGLICGFGASQVTWDISSKVEGEIKITNIDSSNLRWDKNAKSLDTATWIGYNIQLSPALLKEKYCKNPNGTFNLEKCRNIDKMANKNIAIEKGTSSKGDRIFAYEDKNSGASGIAFTGYDISGLKQDQSIELICMFLLDDSLYAPEEKDTKEIKETKEIGKLKYPYGRMVLFSSSEKDKFILEDIALDENFKNIGNIDIFNPIKWEGIEGKSEVDKLIPIQDRINGMYNNYIKVLSENFSTIITPKSSGLTANAIVKFPVIAVNNAEDVGATQYFTNNGIQNAISILDAINQLQTYAYQVSRVNETMLYGTRQTGTTSAEQVIALQENTQTDIRGLQSNFSEWIIAVGEKCLEIIKNKYTVNRLIKLSTNIDNAKYAEIQSINDNERELVLYNEASEVVNRLKFGEDLCFTVEVVAGTEIPRTRKEQANMINQLLSNGIFEKLQDLDLLELYLKMQDIPNYRAIIQLLRQKQDEKNNTPPDYSWLNMFKNPELAKIFADMFDKLGGYSLAKQKMLETIGLPSNPGKIDNTPINEITSKSDLATVVNVAPEVISDNIENVIAGHNAAKGESLIKAIQ